LLSDHGSRSERGLRRANEAISLVRVSGLLAENLLFMGGQPPFADRHHTSLCCAPEASPELEISGGLRLVHGDNEIQGRITGD